MNSGSNKSAEETMGSSNNKPISAPPVAISANTRKLVLRVIIALGMLVGIIIVSSLIRDCVNQPKKHPEKMGPSAQASIPLASSPVADWPKWILPPKGKSEIVPVPSGMHIVMDGSRFICHSRYLDGSEYARDSENPGPAGPDGQVTGSYATNKANEPNIVSYAFAPN